jgi:hypothetical protein
MVLIVLRKQYNNRFYGTRVYLRAAPRGAALGCHASILDLVVL